MRNTITLNEHFSPGSPKPENLALKAQEIQEFKEDV